MADEGQFAELTCRAAQQTDLEPSYLLTGPYCFTATPVYLYEETYWSDLCVPYMSTVWLLLQSHFKDWHCSLLAD